MFRCMGHGLERQEPRSWGKAATELASHGWWRTKERTVEVELVQELLTRQCRLLPTPYLSAKGTKKLVLDVLELILEKARAHWCAPRAQAAKEVSTEAFGCVLKEAGEWIREGALHCHGST